MVSDTAFYVVLGIAIALFAFIIVFMAYLKSKFPPPLMMKLLTTMHAALFGYETALVEFIGTRGYRTHVFPEIVKVMNTLKEDEEIMKTIYNAKTPGDAMEKWMQVMETAKAVEGGSVVQNEDGSFSIIIEKCTMSHPIHEVMGQKKGICPLALIVSSASNIIDSEIEPQISYSEFTPTGTKTHLTLKIKNKDQ